MKHLEFGWMKTNAKDLTKKWIKLKKIKEANYPKLCGIFQNLLKKYNSDEINEAINIFNFYYPYSNIVRFAFYCERLIKHERNKRRKT